MRSNEILEVGSKTLSGYASKGFFKSFSIACAPKDSAEFHFRWHFDKVFVIRLNSKSKKISMPVVLPDVKPRSAMDKDFRSFIAELSDATLPDHRRIPTHQIKAINRSGQLGLTMTLPETLDESSLTNSINQFVTVIHQVYKMFLKNGHYDVYVSETFSIDSDSFW